MGINLRGFHIAMAELFLHGADIGTGFEQVGGTNSSGMNLNSRRLARRGNYRDVVSKRMPERVASDVFLDFGLKGSEFYRLTHASLVQMVTTDKRRFRVSTELIRWKQVVPTELPWCGRIF